MKTICLLLLVPVLSIAQTSTVAPQAERIGDATIQRDHVTYESLQARIKALNDGGRRVADYHLSKAQCWLDASFHEYTRNDRSAFPQAAMGESEKLVAAMEQKAEPLPTETPLVNGAARLRPDLWERTHALKQGRGFACAAQRTACAEVELVHAGNEYNQQGWRHAKPYVQIAEDALGEAESAASRCEPAAVAAVATPVAASPAPAAQGPRTAQRRVLSVDLVFAFDRSDLAGIRHEAASRLDRLLAQARADGLRIESIRVVGHADRLNGTGNAAYNQRLSEKRAATVRAMLVDRGVPTGSIEVSAVGATQPVEACRERRSETVLEACLLPNRRVEVVVTTSSDRR